jgi:UDP-N-acetylglucosamine 2-epimerase
VHIVGCTGLDNLVNIDLSNNRDKPYIVILCHPNTTDAEDITALIEAVKQIDIHKVWVNPNVDAGSKAILKQIHKQEVEFVKDLPPEEYARLINNAQCCVGNSSSFIKEGAFLGTPAVIVGERQHNREHGKNVLFANNATIAQSIKQQIAHGKYQKDYIFGNGKACEKILEVLNDISNNSGTKRLKEG